MSCDPVRRRALEVLLAVAGGERLDPLLERALREAPDPRAGSFLAKLVRGTLQWQGRYDHVISCFSRKRPPTDTVLVGILRLALHQMLGLDGVPPYAAIHQAGELCRRMAGRNKVGFVNGMLQNVRRHLSVGGPDPRARDRKLQELFAPLAGDRVRWLAAWYSLPAWLVSRWLDRFGGDETEKMCAWLNEPLSLHLHVLGDFPLDRALAELAAAGIDAVAGTAPRSLTVAARIPRGELRALLERMPWLVVQDVTVQAATRWLAPPRPRGPVLDMCAAPGGKAAHLRGLWPGSVPLVAMDNRPERVALLADTLRRVAPGTVPVVLGDGAYPPFASGMFGGILLDGPCSGTGVLRHHPDGRWRLRPDTPGRKAGALSALAEQAAGLLAPGGTLMYATCSLEPEENELVLEKLLAGRSDLTPAADADGNWQRYWMPHTMGGDGFFAARLRQGRAS